MYENMRIEKGTIIFMGVWALHHDGNHFKDPAKFEPERYSNHPRLANFYAGSPDFMNRDMCHSLLEKSLLTDLSTPLCLRRRPAHLSRYTSCRTEHVANDSETIVGFSIFRS